MSRYTSHPAGPFMDIDAVRYMRDSYGVPARAAADLLESARTSPSGMANFPRPGRASVWATYMTTQNGKFMIECDSAPRVLNPVPLDVV